MRVNVWGINYAPEQIGIAPYNALLCEYLLERGHEVRMATSFAYYPLWKKAAADCGRLYRTHFVRGVPVYRCWHYVPQRPSAIKRVLHEATFVLTSLLRLLTLPKPDVYVVVSPPLLLGAAAWLLTRFRRAPVVFHVQDLQPDGALALVMIRQGLLARLLYGLESFAYRKAARVSGITPGMLSVYRSKGVPEAKLVYFPNGTTVPGAADIPTPGSFRSRHGIVENAFLAVYSGNVGMKQGLDVLLDAAKQWHNGEVTLVICGEGAGRERLERRIRVERIPNVTLLPLQPEQEYLEMLRDADVALVTQQQGAGRFCFPSKLLKCLALAKPVVTVADEASELAQALNGAGFGVNVLPGDAQGLASTLKELSRTRDKLKAYGVNGRGYAAQFELSRVLGEFERGLLALVGDGVGTGAARSASSRFSEGRSRSSGTNSHVGSDAHND